MYKAKGPEWGSCVVCEDFTEYLLDFMGPCGMVMSGGFADAERSKGVIQSNLSKAIGHLTDV